ncbi:hypothetical protein FACS1894125_0810 [Actinomycetota bacterium]|nr:hypothetical protein FACS1894125_0810 [Actinomycetota bacterium]
MLIGFVLPANADTVSELYKLKQQNEARQAQLGDQITGVSAQAKALALQIDSIEYYEIPAAQLEYELLQEQADNLEKRSETLNAKLQAAKSDKERISQEADTTSKNLDTTKISISALAREDLRSDNTVNTLKLVTNAKDSDDFILDLQELDQLTRTTSRLNNKYVDSLSTLNTKAQRLDAVDLLIQQITDENTQNLQAVEANKADSVAKLATIQALGNELEAKKAELEKQLSELNTAKDRTDAEHAQLEEEMNQAVRDAIAANGGLPDLSGTGMAFDPGYIIDDAKFYTSGTMGIQEIQDFLNRVGVNCHSRCLKDYRVTSIGEYKATSGCAGFASGVNMSAAEAISNASRACNISEKVLLVMLQKEQGLLTIDNPSDTRYSHALGYGCPDGSACDPSVGGLFDQLYNASWQFNYYKSNANVYSVKPFMNNNISYHPSGGCGYKQVYVQNYATAGLYVYTPYVPNESALAAGLGLGDSCSSYGNRNFYYLYLTYFGSAK